MLVSPMKNGLTSLFKEVRAFKVLREQTFLVTNWQYVTNFIAQSNSEEFQKPQPLLVSQKVLQYTSNLYGSNPPICIAVPS